MRVQFRARLGAAGWKLAGWTVFTAGFVAGLALIVYRAAHGTGTVGDIVLAITIAVSLRDAVRRPSTAPPRRRTAAG